MTKTSEAYKYLYHYTTEDALIKILESQSLWATHIEHLNDSSEFVHFKDISPKLIFDDILSAYRRLVKTSPDAEDFLKRFGRIEQVAEHNSIKFIESMYKATGNNFFITSFCGQQQDEYINQNGLLSQWRGYGSKQQGVMIEFETKGLESLLMLENASFAYDGLHLSDVIYSSNSNIQQTELSDSIAAIAHYTGSLLTHKLFNTTEEPDAGNAMSGFFQCTTRYKHRGFIEEREVRVAAWVRNTKTQAEIEKIGGTPAALKPVKHRERNKKKVPFINLFEQKEMQLPITKIIVGPHAKKEEFAERLKTQLEGTSIEIAISDIPYVNFYS